jgi:hypothetical protein
MDDKKVFRSAFLITFIHSYLGFAALVFVTDGFQINLIAFAVASGGMVLLNLVAIGCLKIVISPSGIKGYNFWGYRHFAEWDRIVEVKPIKFIGLRYLRIFHAPGKRPIWLPLFLVDMEGFESEIKRVASPSNPVNLFFRDQ